MTAEGEAAVTGVVGESAGETEGEGETEEAAAPEARSAMVRIRGDDCLPTTAVVTDGTAAEEAELGDVGDVFLYSIVGAPRRGEGRREKRRGEGREKAKALLYNAQRRGLQMLFNALHCLFLFLPLSSSFFLFFLHPAPSSLSSSPLSLPSPCWRVRRRPQ